MDKAVYQHTDYSSLLPAELLLAIFEYLPLCSRATVAQVCRRWRCIVYHPSLWIKVQVSPTLLNVRDAKALADSLRLRRISNISVNTPANRKAWKCFLAHLNSILKYLDLSHCGLGLPVINECFSAQFSQLTCLNLSHTRVTKVGLSKICRCLPQLGQLKLEHFALDSSDPMDNWIELIIKFLTNLVDLSLSHTTLSWEDCNLLAQGDYICKLSRLCVDGNRRLPLDIFDGLNLVNMEHLSISGSTFSPFCLKTMRYLISLRASNLPDIHIPSLGMIKNLTHLKALDLSNNKTVNDGTVQLVVDYVPNLAVLHINDCTGVTGIGANLIACNMTDLQILSINSIVLNNPGLFLSNIANYLKKLHSFSCVGCAFVPSVICSKLSPLNLKYLIFRNHTHIERLPKSGIPIYTELKTSYEQTLSYGEAFFKPSSSYF